MTETGELNKRVAIQSRDDPPAKNAAGEPIESWSTDDTVWAKIQTATGKELYVGQQVKAELSHKITIRYYSGLTTAHRLLYDSRVFDINYVIDVDERHIWHELLCKEVA